MSSTVRALPVGDIASSADNELVDLEVLAEQQAHFTPSSLDIFADLLTRARWRSCNCLLVEPDRRFWRLRYRAVNGLEEELVHDPEPLVQMLSELGNALWSGANRDWPRYGCCRFRVAGEVLALRIDALPASNGLNYRIELYPDPARPCCLDTLGMTHVQLATFRQLLAETEGWVIVAGADRVNRSILLDAVTADVTSPDRRILSLAPRIHPYLPRTIQLVIEDLDDDRQVALCKAALQQEFDTVVLHRQASTSLYKRLAAQEARGTLLLEGLDAHGRSHVLKTIQQRKRHTPEFNYTVRGLVIQHSVRRLCPACSERTTPPPGVRRWLAARETPACYDVAGWLEELGNDGYFTAPGCLRCHQTGYVGLIPVFDIVASSDALASILSETLDSTGFSTGRAVEPNERLTRRVMTLAQRGDTTLAEAVRILRQA